MTELTPKIEASGRNDVDTASVGLLTIDTVSRAITSCNDAFAEVVGRTADDVHGCPITDFVDDEAKSIATAVIDGIRAGFISSVDGNVDLSRQAGSVGVDCWILALGTDLPRRMAMAGVIPGGGSVPAEAPPSEPGLRPPQLDLNRVVLATLDDGWRILEVAPGSASQLGWPDPRATTVMPQLHELVHPADAPVLNGSFGRLTSTETPDTVTLRLRGPDERWLSSRVTVSPLRGSAAARFGLVISLGPTGEPGETESERLARLEDQLARIRQVVQSASGDAGGGPVDLSDLTVRQREIVERMLGGHRVDAIARDLCVSPSTVRNHLSAIFEKLGVASQSELVELLRGHAGGSGSTFGPGVA